MANQMIALGVRGPQLPNLGNMAQQFANTMAATATARERRGAAERQMQFRQLVGSEGFDAGNPEHIRAAAALDPAGAEALGRSFTTRRAADQEFDTREMVRLRNLAVAVMRAADPEAAYQSWLTEVEAADPRSGALFRQASPTYQPEFMTNVLMEADQYIDKSVSTPTSSVQFTPGGDAFEVNVGGVGDPTAREVIVTSRNNTSPTPTAGTPAAETGLNARPGETPGQIKGRGIPAENVPTGSPLVRPTEAAAPGLTPASAGGEMGGVQPLDMQTAPLIIQNAVQNRVIDPTHMQQLREMVGPENERNLAAWMQQHQIRIQPPGEAPIQPGMRSAEYRPDMAPAPQFQQVQSVNQVGTQFRGRDPMQSPVPGSDLISIERSAARAGAEAEASREDIGRAAVRERETTRAQGEAEASTIYERTRRERQAENDAAFANTYASSSSTVRDGLNVINQLIGDATVVNGAVTIPRGGRRTHRGFQGLVGIGIPGVRFVPGSPVADADALYEQVQGRAFLEAFETLKGGGAITEAEGRAATAAISRLGRNISEVEFVRAANEVRDIMRRALARADRRAAALGLTPPPTAAAPARRQPAPPRGAERTRSGARVNWPGR